MSPEWKNNFITLSDDMTMWRYTDDCLQPGEGRPKLPTPAAERSPGRRTPPGGPAATSPARWRLSGFFLKPAPATAVATLELLRGGYLSRRLAAPPSGSFFGMRNPRFRSMKTCWGQSCCTAAVRRQCAGGIRCIFLCQILSKVSSTICIMAKKKKNNTKTCKENF